MTTPTLVYRIEWECVGCGRRYLATTQVRACEDRHERGLEPEDD